MNEWIGEWVKSTGDDDWVILYKRGNANADHVLTHDILLPCNLDRFWHPHAFWHRIFVHVICSQDKGVFLLAVGITKAIKMHQLTQLAGQRGQAMSVPSFYLLTRQIPKMMESICRKCISRLIRTLTTTLSCYNCIRFVSHGTQSEIKFWRRHWKHYLVPPPLSKGHFSGFPHLFSQLKVLL